MEDLAAGYGGSQVLAGRSLAVGAGEVVTLLGRNGMGKTTTHPRRSWGCCRALGGRVLGGRIGIRRHRAARAGRRTGSRQLGLGLVPEGRQVFPTLTRRGEPDGDRGQPASARRAGGCAEVFGLFPRLEERRRQPGAQLSGGEQQMLAIGRALMTNPRLLLLDEATEGLAPLVRAEIWAVLARLKAEGQAILLIDKNLGAVLRLADRHVVVEKGRTVWTGSSAALAAAPGLRETYLHV